MLLVLRPAAPPKNTVVKVINPLDTSLEATFEDSYHRRVGYASQVRVAKGARLVSCAREAGLTVWRILKKNGINQDEEVELYDESSTGSWQRVLEMELSVHSNIVAHEISDDGKWLAVSDLYETKLFSLYANVSFENAFPRISHHTSCRKTNK